MHPHLDGILVIDKPAGPTSHDIVQQVKRLIGAKKVGHLGTLDPPASGVLPLAINGATKRARELAGVEKVYEFALVLGAATDTDDETGRVTAVAPIPHDALDRLQRIIPQFVGDILQRPPAISAVKVNGVRSYRLAREQGAVALPPRPVHIDALGILDVRLPEIRLRLRCRTGTYVRALCRDIGEALGCRGHARSICRLQSGPYVIGDAVAVDALAKDPGGWVRWLKAPHAVLPSEGDDHHDEEDL